MGDGRRRWGRWAAAVAAAGLAAVAVVAVPALAGRGPHAKAGPPTLAGLAKQVKALRSQDAALRRRVAALAGRRPAAGIAGAVGGKGDPGAPGSPGAQGIQGVPGPVGLAPLSASLVVAGGSFDVPLVSTPDLGTVAVSCVPGGPVQSPFLAGVRVFDTSAQRLDVEVSHTATDGAEAVGARLSPGTEPVGFLPQAVAASYVIHVATADAPEAQAVVVVSTRGAPGGGCLLHAFGWRTA